MKKDVQVAKFEGIIGDFLSESGKAFTEAEHRLTHLIEETEDEVLKGIFQSVHDLLLANALDKSIRQQLKAQQDRANDYLMI